MEPVDALLRAARRPLLITHIAPDGDGIGSLLGLGWAMKEIGRHPTLACADPVPRNLAFLPGADTIVAQPTGAEDLAVALDCADLQRLGSLYGSVQASGLTLLNIDHHVTNSRFGDAHEVVSSAASTSQMVYALLRRLGWPLSPWTATCLLTGLVTDTRSFRTPNTDISAMRTALALMEAGAPLAEINEQLERGLSLGVISLWGRVLSNTRLRDGVIWAEVSLQAQRECGVSSADSSGLVSFIASAREAHIAVLLTERADGHVEVGLRSAPGIDVAAVALALGGGGHRQAAGCTLPGPLDAAREAVLAQLQPLLQSLPKRRARQPGGSDAVQTVPMPSR
ncbi:MAG: bifunctional oligoribonuclease/PAP phosphatase NrnA [Anaerolineae bacterium]|nr:bifunctional oligoribonuclease/PAP phosphatase NrnA [Anaerolineae bacterium]